MTRPTEPKFDDVSITPNPVEVMQNIIISVGVSEQQITTYVIAPYSGMSNSNDSIILQKYFVESN